MAGSGLAGAGAAGPEVVRAGAHAISAIVTRLMWTSDFKGRIEKGQPDGVIVSFNACRSMDGTCSTAGKSRKRATG